MKVFRIGGYYPGLVGDVVRTHAVYYASRWGLDRSFETEVGGELSAFAARFDPKRDLLLSARLEGDAGFAGFAAVDGGDGQSARFRWFIVAPECAGAGLGRTLLDKAVGFCGDAGHEELALWTFAGLNAARRLYEQAGFSLVEERFETIWGQRLLRQKFVLAPTGS